MVYSDPFYSFFFGFGEGGTPGGGVGTDEALLKEARGHKKAEVVICLIFLTSVEMTYGLSHAFPFQTCQFGLNYNLAAFQILMNFTRSLKIS